MKIKSLKKLTAITAKLRLGNETTKPKTQLSRESYEILNDQNVEKTRKCQLERIILTALKAELIHS